jgi:alkyl hydroperoxide reductase subunit AhpC
MQLLLVCAGCRVDECLRMVKCVRAVDRARGTLLAPADYHTGRSSYITNTMAGIDTFYRYQ